MCSGAESRAQYQSWPIVVKHPMPTAALNDPILKRFRTALEKLYGDRIERVVLYRSRIAEILA